MPRLARLDAPGVLHHTIIRGIERRKIFRENKDRDDFMESLSTILGETNTPCYVWPLLGNHTNFQFKKRSIRNIEGDENTSYGICSNI